MIREKFLQDLRFKAIEKNLNADELVEKYSKRFDLGLEAGMSENEIVERFGNIDDILCGLSGYNNENIRIKKKIKEFEVNTAGLEKLIVERDSGDSIKVKFSDADVKELYEIEEDEDSFSLSRIKQIKGLKLSYKGAIKIIIGDLIEIENLDFNLVNQQNDFTNITLCANNGDINVVTGLTKFDHLKFSNLDYNQVSGDTFINNISVDEFDLNMVSGTISINDSNADNIDINSTSGEINIAGNINSYDVQTISGVVTINGKIVNKTIAQAIKDAIKKRGL